MLYREKIKKLFLSKTTGRIWKHFGIIGPLGPVFPTYIHRGKHFINPCQKLLGRYENNLVHSIPRLLKFYPFKNLAARDLYPV